MKNLSADIHSRTDVALQRLCNSRRDKAVPYLYQKSKSGFTLVELLVAISILATISIVGYVSAHSYIMKANNSRRITSMDTLKSSLNNYYQIKKTLPDPDTNRIYYDERGTYMHSSTGSYGVSGHASRHWYSEDYANNFAFDPETKQFFGYGKLSDNSAFDIATALYVDTGIYKAYVDGTYDGGRFPSLVRAYHSSDFVVQDSTEFLPYNPFERKVTAKIITYSGTIAPVVWIGSMNGVTCTQPTPALSLTWELMTGDCIGVGTGSTALLHISDGSELSLGSTGSTTILELKDLRYKDSEDPITSVLIKLISGEVWAEAPRLRAIGENESEMQIYTTTALAAVRGTVFGVSVSSTGVTNLSLAAGEIKVGRNPVVNTWLPLIGSTSVTSSPFGSTDGFSTTATGGFVLSGSTSSMIVPDGGKAISLTVSPPVTHDGTTTTPSASTGSIDSSTLQQKLHFIPFGLGYRPVVTDVSFTGTAVGSTTGMLTVKFENPGATSYRLAFGTGEWSDIRLGTDNMQFLTGVLDAGQPVVTVTGSFAILPLLQQQERIVSLKLCYQDRCSAPYIHGVGNVAFSFKNMDYKIPERKNCPEDQKWFGELGCQPKELVAYAPYNRPSDILMYTSQWWSLGFSTNKIVGSGSNAYTDDTYHLRTAMQEYPSKNGCVPVFTGGTMAFASDTCSSITNTVSLNNLISKGYRFDVLSSFFDVLQPTGGSVRGVYIDNKEYDDYLKYDLSALELSDKFSIEVSVRGAALKRGSTGNFRLFNFSGWTNDVNLSMFNGELRFYLSNILNSYTRSIITASLLSQLSENTFYKVVSRVENGIPSLTILDNFNNVLLNGSTSTNWWIVTNYWNELYIWSKYDKTFQWNDIIDHVKIYRK